MIAELQLFKGQHMKILYLNDWLMERRPLLVDETVCCTRWRTGSGAEARKRRGRCSYWIRDDVESFYVDRFFFFFVLS